jgi:uncharacterized membrane protein YdjX (TVP38/TMEM64 family)
MTKEAVPPAGEPSRPGRWLAGALLVTLIVLFFVFRLDRTISWDSLILHRDELKAWVDAHWAVAAVLFVAVYVAVTGLSLPGAAILTLAGGLLFGIVWGTILASISSTAGASLAFLHSRYLLRDWVRRRFGGLLERIDRGIEKDGGFYLFTLRLVAGFPFFAVNAAMGLTRMRLWTFWWVSQLGMLPGTIVYINAGAHLRDITGPRDVFTWPVLLSFALLGVLPLALRLLLRLWQSHRTAAPPNR